MPLVTLTSLKEYVGVQTTDTSEDAYLTASEARMVRIAEQLTNRTLLYTDPSGSAASEDANIVELLQGTGTPVIHVRSPFRRKSGLDPIVEVRGSATDAWSTLASTAYEIDKVTTEDGDPRRRRILRLDLDSEGLDTWQRPVSDWDNVRATYHAGYASETDADDPTPLDIAEAIRIMVASAFRDRFTATASEKREWRIPDEAREILERYVTPRVLAIGRLELA